MKILLSPSKTLYEDLSAIQLPEKEVSLPEFLPETKKIVKELKSLNEEKLAELMSVSPKLATLNHERYKKFKTPFTSSNTAPALLQFEGDVYKGITAKEWDKKTRDFAARSVRILSGLYGMLRPWDRMHPYRLEMGTKLKVNGKRDLYHFWGNQITEALLKECKKGEVVVNLASKEYSKVVDLKVFGDRVVEPVFQEEKDGKRRVVALFAKQARGLMTEFVVRERVTEPEGLKDFRAEGYRFRKGLSDSGRYYFVRK